MSTTLNSPDIEPTTNQSARTTASERHLVLVDDQIDKQAREQIARCRIAKRKVVVTSSIPEATALLEKGTVDGVIAGLRNIDDSLFLLQVAAASNASVRRFVSASQQEINPLIASQHCILPRQWVPSLVEDTVSRELAIGRWEANPSLAGVMEYIQKIPTLSTLYTQITEALESENCSAEEVGRLIARDPAITAKLLQCVNAGAVGLSRRISNPREAVMFFGIKKIRSLVLLSSLFVQFDGAKCSSFSATQSFEQSLDIAGWSSSVMMGETQDKKLAEMSFTAGLLHNFGVLLLAVNLPESYGQLLHTASERHVPIDVVELETYGATHADVGGFILAKWGLPFPIISAVAWHTTPYRSEETELSPLTAVHIAKAAEGYRRTGKVAFDCTYTERVGLPASKVENWARSLIGETLYW